MKDTNYIGVLPLHIITTTIMKNLLAHWWYEWTNV